MRRIFGTLLLLALAAPVAAQGPAPAPGYVVIVHPRNPVTSLDRKQVGRIFLKKVTRWSDDEVVRPVDASVRSPTRRRFSQDVLSRSVAAVKSYWQQLVFSGRGIPPPELDSDEAIVSYVLKHRGAIGYVSSTTNLNGARIVGVR